MMAEETPLDAPRTDEPDTAEVTTPDDGNDGAETFPAKVVHDLRREAAGYRDRAKTAEAKAEGLARQLHTALVRADGRLHNPDDLPYLEDHLTNPDALEAGITAVLLDRPYLRARKVTGDVGQGKRGEAVAPKDFSALFR